MALNVSHPQLRVNFLEYWMIKEGQQTVFSWITDLKLNPHTVEPIMRAGRARWKVENETFNSSRTKAMRWNTTTAMASSTYPVCWRC